MAKKRRRRRRRGVQPWMIILGVIAIVAAIIVVIVVVSNNSPSKECLSQSDLSKLYNITGNSLPGVEANRYAVVVDGEIMGEEDNARSINGVVYVKKSIVSDYIDNRFYYDNNESILLLTNALQTIEVGPDQSYYTISDEQIATEYAIWTVYEGEVYIATQFVDDLTNAKVTVYEEPNRVVVEKGNCEKTFCDVTVDTQIRTGEKKSIKDAVIAEITAGSKLQVLEDAEDWIKVVSEEGWIGYVKASDVSDKYTESVAPDSAEPEYTHLSLGTTVKIGWSGIYGTAANDNYYEYMGAAGTALNVYCPTWYFLTDGDGGMNIFSDSEIVASAHADGYQVWAMLKDENYDYVKSVLTRTSVRRGLISTIITDMLETGIDGINVDFECILTEYGDDFIQFIRELSVACRYYGFYLSVDNYAPYEYNSCYHAEEQNRLCDYVMLMAYDDYVGTGEAGPNSSLPFIQEVLELMISKVDADRVVVGFPFYTRFWKIAGDGTLTKEECGMTTAWNTIEQVAATASWDETLGLDYAEYSSGNETVKCWLESSDSVRAKINLIQSYNVAGVAFWRLGQESNQCWEVIAEY